MKICFRLYYPANEQATTAHFDAALGRLIDESKEGDQAKD